MEKAIHFLTDEELQALISLRDGELKIGETIQRIQSENWETELAQSTAKFVILGMPEDIGVRANGGLGGANSAWKPFLKSFLNIQDNAFFSGKEMLLLGMVAVEDLMEQCTPDALLPALREAVVKLDALLTPIIKKIVKYGKIPILIGGGHNNAYPLLRGLSEGVGRAINVVNLDAHADFRALEGRHSGNGFSYAHAEGFLNSYLAFGLHQAYNNAAIIKQFEENETLKAVWFEELNALDSSSFSVKLSESLKHVNKNKFGVELDLDCIQDTLSSAQSPIGFSRMEALHFLKRCGEEQNSAYLHLTEGVAVREDHLQFPMIGKLLSYMVQAFIKSKLESKHNS